VRFASERADLSLALTTVLAAGLVLIAPVALAFGDWSVVGADIALKAVAAGLAYAVGGYALYRAFSIGPVRLVAPVIGAFPILSLVWASVQGRVPTPGQALAVVAIVVGVALGAILSAHDDKGDHRARTGQALTWSFAAAFGFALTFAFGQAGSHGGSELPVVLISRATSLMAMAAVVLASGARPSFRTFPWRLLAVMGLCDGVALGLVQAAGGLPNPEFASVASSVFGIVTILLAWAFLKERMSAPQWGSVALVFAGIGYLAI
jgi:drug/metabolite transporter (DMT)-like permease